MYKSILDTYSIIKQHDYPYYIKNSIFHLATNIQDAKYNLYYYKVSTISLKFEHTTMIVLYRQVKIKAIISIKN